MGTVASIHVHDGAPVSVIEDAIDAVLAELERFEVMFSTFRPDSEISQINTGTRTLADCSPEVVAVLDACTWLEHSSGGAFSAYIPGRAGQIDPSGFVKGWATEQAARRLGDAGLEHYYVSVGGDLLVHGSPATDRKWHVAIADPYRKGHAIASVEIASGAVATSGTNERGAHIWDARRARGPERFVAVTVVGPSLAWADAFATTAFVLGADGPAWVNTFDGYATVVIEPDGTVRASGAVVVTPGGSQARC
jgi:thiamine biosynthesis lipoprotein